MLVLWMPLQALRLICRKLKLPFRNFSHPTESNNYMNARRILAIFTFIVSLAIALAGEIWVIELAT
jgi:hypothetical protein